MHIPYVFIYIYINICIYYNIKLRDYSYFNSLRDCANYKAPSDPILL